MNAARLSLVIPCFNEEEGLPVLRKRLERLSLFKQKSLELVLVDDGSRDGTGAFLSRWSAESAGVKAVHLKDNRGVQEAIFAGIAASCGEAVAVLDADLQDPPELLEAMLERFESEHAAAVIGIKTKRRDSSALLSLAKNLATCVLPLKRGEGDFGILRRERALSLIQIEDASIPFRARRYWILRGEKILYFPYERQSRSRGYSKFNLKKMAALWWDLFKWTRLRKCGT